MSDTTRLPLNVCTARAIASEDDHSARARMRDRYGLAFRTLHGVWDPLAHTVAQQDEAHVVEVSVEGFVAGFLRGNATDGWTFVATNAHGAPVNHTLNGAITSMIEAAAHGEQPERLALQHFSDWALVVEAKAREGLEAIFATI